MELFGNNFLRIRNNHLLPRIHYGVKRTKYEFWSLKEVFTKKIISLNKLNGNAFEIELPKEDYYKAIHCDIELFMNKVFVQYSDFKKQNGVSPTWSFITLYYFTFFNATCLFRFIDKGFIFLNKEQSKHLEDFSIALYSDSISVNTGNYYFSVKEINLYGNIVLTLNYKGESVHKSTWVQMESTLRDFVRTSDSNEMVVYKLLLNHFVKFKSDYPSNLRNKLNYNGDSSIIDLENSIPYLTLKDINLHYLKELTNLDTSISNNINQMKSTCYLTSFLFELNKKLYKEYIDRSGFGKDFNKERINYVRRKRIDIDNMSANISL
jgi:hypothetical protein